MLFRARIDPTKFKADRTSWGARRFSTIAVLLNVIAIRTLEMVRYDLT